METSRKLITRVGFEVLALICLGAGFVIMHKKVEPFQRGFYCDDENIKKPFKEDTVSEMLCFVIWAFLAAAILIPVEMVSFITHPTINTTEVKVPTLEKKIPALVVELYRIIGSFTIGGVFCMFATEMCKITIGELRPHFLSLCNIDLTKDLCKCTSNVCDGEYHVYVEDFNCTFKSEVSGVKFEEEAVWNKKVKDARKSFLSGHSAFSFYCAVYLTLYLGTRLINLKTKEKFIGQQRSGTLMLLILKALRPFIQFGLLATAFYICLSRVSDYKHHPRDVIAGGLFGSLSAYLTITYIANLANKPRLVYNDFDQLDGKQVKKNDLDQLDGKEDKKESEIITLESVTIDQSTDLQTEGKVADAVALYENQCPN